MMKTACGLEEEIDAVVLVEWAERVAAPPRGRSGCGLSPTANRAV